MNHARKAAHSMMLKKQRPLADALPLPAGDDVEDEDIARCLTYLAVIAKTGKAEFAGQFVSKELQSRSSSAASTHSSSSSGSGSDSGESVCSSERRHGQRDYLQQIIDDADMESEDILRHIVMYNMGAS